MNGNLKKLEKELLDFKNEKTENIEKDNFKKIEKVEKVNDNFTILDMSKYDRPREKMQILGADSLSIEELIAIIIGTGSFNNNALELGHKIHNRLLEENNFLDITI